MGNARAVIECAGAGAREANGEATYHVTGNRDTVMAVGQHLLKKRGVAKQAIYLRNHWVGG